MTRRKEVELVNTLLVPAGAKEERVHRDDAGAADPKPRVAHIRYTQIQLIHSFFDTHHCYWSLDLHKCYFMLC